MVHLLAARVILGLCLAQDPTVAEILLKMEEAVREARGTSFQFKRPLDPEAYGVYKVASDGALAVTYGSHLAMSLTKEGVYISDREYFPAEFATLERYSIGNPLPPSFLQSQPEAWILQALAPDRTIPFGQSLKVEGRQTIEGEEYFILAARFPAFVRTDRSGAIGFCGTGSFDHKEDRVRWGVSTRDFRLKWLEERSIQDPVGRDSYHRVRFLEWKGGVPGRIVLNGWMESDEGDLKDEYEICSFKPGLDIPPDAVRPPRGELIATRGRDPSAIKDLDRSPDDPDLLYSAALVYLRTAPGNRNNLPDTRPAINNLEKALAKQWGDAPAFMLMSLYNPEKDSEKLNSLLAAAEKRSDVSADFRKAVAKLLVKSGKAERALVLLPKGDSHPPFTFKERIDVLEAAGKRDLALDELAVVNSDAARGWHWLFECFLRRGAEGVPESVDRALARHPESPILWNLALRLAWDRKDPERYLKLAKSTVPKKFGGWVDRLILEILGYWLSRPNPQGTSQLSAERIQGLKSEFLNVLKGLDSQPKSPPLQAAVHRICEDRESARKALEDAIARAPRWESYDQMQTTCPVLLFELEQFGDDALWERGLRATFEQLKRLPFPYLIPSHALGSYIKQRTEKGTAGRLYHEFKGFPFGSHGSSDSIFGAQLEYQVGQQAAASIVEEARKNPRDAEGQKWMAQTIEREGSRWAEAGRPFQPLEFYLKALEVKPDDVECLDRAGHHLRANKDYAGARRCGERLLRLIEEGKGIVGGPSAEQVRIRLVQLDVTEGLNAEGEKRLRSISWESPRLRAAHVWSGAELWVDMGKPEEALTLLRELVARGYRPHLRMAELYGNLNNPVEQVRHLNRALAEGIDFGPWRETGDARQHMRRPAVELERMKTKIREKVGPDVFVKAFLSLKHPSLTGDEERRARECTTRLGSEDIREREEAMAELRKFGPGAAPLVAQAYTSDDANVRNAARIVLESWAEPR